MNIFEKVSRNKTRFPSDRGELTTEQLWDLSLTSLDTIARKINRDLKELAEESFINTSPDPRKPGLELQIAVLKHIIQVKLDDQEAQKVAATKAAKRKALLEALANREAADMAGKTSAQLMKELEELD